jgi:hypothetical protein
LATFAPACSDPGQEIESENEKGTQPNPVLNDCTAQKVSFLDHKAVFGYFLG